MVLQRGLGRGELGEVVALVVLAPHAAGRARVLVAEALLLEGLRLVAALLGGRRRRLGCRAVGLRSGRTVGRAQVGALEQRVFGEVALELLVELDRRQLEQPDRLLELRREGEVLR